MSKNTNLSFLTDYITADITNGRIGINNASPAYAFDVTGIARTSTSTYLATASGSVGIGTTSPTDFIDATSGVAIIAPSGRSGLSLGSTQGTADEILARLSFTNTNSTNAGGKRLSYISGIRGTTNNSAYLEFGTANDGLGTQRMVVSQTGNVGIGTSSPSVAGGSYTGIDIRGSGGGSLVMGSTSTLMSYIYADSGALTLQTTGSIPILFIPGGYERMRITSGGNVLINQSATDAAAGGAVFQLTQGNANWIHFIKNSNTSGNVYGSNILFSYAPNNTASAFFGGSDSSTERYRMYANGGLANYATNNVVLSDERLKKDIIPLESVWNKIKNIEIVKYKFKDQTHDDFNMGVIAQQVEKIAPELIEIEGWGTLAEDGSTYKGIYETDINYYSIKALQEAMAKIEILESEITILKQK